MKLKNERKNNVCSLAKAQTKLGHMPIKLNHQISSILNALALIVIAALYIIFYNTLRKI
jgi:hypothetical protein